ncbi:hypothetical protein AB0B07_11080 [Streptomyces sioyaensis]|uniref:hypothetical protein n=1 Tax=Streptomyces sioyaensis TaxID=67364 RepID=UPI0033C2364D
MGHSEERAEGAGPFITRLTWRLEEGGTAVWESRAARKRGTLAVRPAGAAESSRRRADMTPDMIGCVLFLVSGHLAVIEVCHGRPCFHRRSLGWWIVAVNQLGSALFMVSALAAFTWPATGSLVNVGVANWGTLTGALCFAVAGVLQAYERP